MKFLRCLPVCALLAFGYSGSASKVSTKDRKITEVVKLLQSLLEQSKAEGDTEQNLYGKYKCYCDTNEAAKKASIAKLKDEISILESKIEELQASTGGLSTEVAKLDADMTQNLQDRDQATAIRDKEHTEFLAKEADLKQALDQMKLAIETLSNIGADQTLNTAQDHTQYMAGYKGEGLLKLKSSIKSALLAAASFVSQKQVKKVESFLQAPFTGTYAARSGEVVGILKDMRDTFSANLKSAQETEAKAQVAYDKYMKEMKAAYDAMEASFNTKQANLAANDEDLASKRGQLEAAEAALAEDEDFLAKLLDMCAAKKKQYDERVALRTQEQAALSEAIAILNSDAAFTTFGGVNATSDEAESFLQQRSLRQQSVRRHSDIQADPRRKAIGFLQSAGSTKGSSPLLAKIAAMIQANNPFKVVLAEIEKMIALLEKEGTADVEQKAWCDKERKEANDGIAAADIKIGELTAAIDELTRAIHDPETGLLVQIKETEDSLEQNYNTQVSATKSRTEENVAYQKDISTLVDAEALLEQAIKVLKTYYAKITDSALIQVKKDDPAPPATWEDTYKGQSTGGTSAIEMLEFILKDTKNEERQAHDDELEAQHSFEDLMIELKDSEKAMQESLASLQETLATTEETLHLKQTDLAKTMEEKAALEAYLLKIKPGCDFIDENLEMRNDARAKEKDALTSATSLLKGSPAYAKYTEEKRQEGSGDCKVPCNALEDGVDCKACLAKVTVPAYCAGHPATKGC
mmetsp:Transcript_1130/g.2493  ORF Transcript_1130/g.2493 Transcript_1130/m.2493 type:complete len:751 (+) Transcript_1130:111-2363(+)